MKNCTDDFDSGFSVIEDEYEEEALASLALLDDNPSGEDGTGFTSLYELIDDDDDSDTWGIEIVDDDGYVGFCEGGGDNTDNNTNVGSKVTSNTNTEVSDGKTIGLSSTNFISSESTTEEDSVEKRKKKTRAERRLINFTANVMPVSTGDPFGINVDLSNDAQLSDVLPTPIKFHGNRNAVFLIIVDAPTAEDAAEENGIIDSKKKILKPMENIISNFYREIFTYPDYKPKRKNPKDYSIAMVSTCMGWHGDKFRTNPTAPEIAASAPHLQKLIQNMHNLRLIFVVGKYTDELFVHHMCPYRMYMKSKNTTFHRHDTPSDTMERRRTRGQFSHVYVGDVSHRYVNLPFQSDKQFGWMVSQALFRLEDVKNKLLKYPICTEPYDVRTPPVSLNCDPKEYYTAQSFKDHLYEDMRFLYNHRRRKTISRRNVQSLLLDDKDTDNAFDGIPNTPSPLSSGEENSLSMTNAYDRAVDDENLHLTHPAGLFRDVSLDPYLSTDSSSDRFVCMRQINYDQVNNVMNMYCHTPEGNPILVSVRDMKFTFWVKPHVNFAETDTLWPDDEKDLKDEHLVHLRNTLRKKLHYIVKDRIQTITGKDGTVHDPFEISLAYGHHDYKEGYWHNREFVFLRFDVRNHTFIQPLLNNLKKIVTGNDKRKKERFVSYQIYSPEHMFIYKYNFLMSHWLKINGLKIQPARGIAPGEDIYHSRVLYSDYSLDDKLASITLLDPANNIPIGNTGLTSSDMPPDIRMAFDIETWYERGVREHDNTPIICICLAVRKHHPLTSRFDSEFQKDANGKPTGPPPTFVPKDGYVYYTFVMGNVAKPTENSNHLGPEFVFSFMREDDLIKSFYLLRRLLLPNYVTTHNGKNFDEVRIYNRAIMLGVEYESLGFREDQCSRLVNSVFQSKAHGERKQYFFESHEGIVAVDTLMIAFRELKRRSYKLGSLSYDYAGNMTKHDMPYDAIKGHWIKDPDTRRVLVDYCIRDAQLPDQITNCRQSIPTICELARVTGNVSEDKIHEKGMQEKVLGAMMQVNYANGHKVLMPTTKWWMKQHNEEVEDYYVKKMQEKIREELSTRDKEIQGLSDSSNRVNLNDDNTVVATLTNTLQNLNISSNTSTPSKPGPGRKKQCTSESRTLQTPAKNWFVPSSVTEVHSSYNPKKYDPKAPIIYAKNPTTKKRVAIGRGTGGVHKDFIVSQFQNPFAAAASTNQRQKRNAPSSTTSSSSSSSSTTLEDEPPAKRVFTAPQQTMEEKRREIEKKLSEANAANNALTKKADYAGAVVMKVDLGWRRERPLGCADFASLYPSIVMANNLDSNTKVFEDEMELRGVTRDMVYDPPTSLTVINPRTKNRVRAFFVKPEYRKGLLAETEQVLVAKRGVAKKLIPKYQNQYLADGVTPNPDYDKNKADVMEQRSNGLKLVGNSGYGIKGTETDVGDKHIAATVTAYGRDYIMIVRAFTEEEWKAVCGGGDTDSCFFAFVGNEEGDFRFDTVEELEKFATEIWEKELNKHFRYPVKIEYEKAMDEFIALSKKRYIYWLCLKGKEPKLTFKGCENVRRDSLPFTQSVMDRFFRIMMERPTDGREDRVKEIRAKYADTINGLRSQIIEMMKSLALFPKSEAEEKLSELQNESSSSENPEITKLTLHVRQETEENLLKLRRQFPNIENPELKELLGELRENNINMTKEVDTCRKEMDKVWISARKEIAINYVKEQGRRLLNGEVPISELILSKGISREYYSNQKQEHLTVARKLEERGLQAPTFGDRVPFVYTTMPVDPQTRKPRKGYEIADDPEWVIKNEIPINYSYYFDHKFVKPVVAAMRYFLMEDMCARIARREEKMHRLHGKEPVVNVTLKAVREETERFLFKSPEKRSTYARHEQLRHCNMTGFRISSAKADKVNRGSIAFYASEKKPTVKSQMKKFSLGSKREALQHLHVEYEEKISCARKSHETKKAELDVVHAHCRDCLKIKDTEKVVCANNDCKEYYWKRIILEGQEEAKSREVVKLEKERSELPPIQDIEDLF